MIENMWNKLESIVHYVVLSIFKCKMSDEKWKSFMQFIKFGIVGLLNTAISYVTYLIMVLCGINYTFANFVGFTVSVINSYYWNNKYVFVTGEKRIWWKTLIRTYVSYAGTGLVLSSILLILWIEVFNISKTAAPLINLVITIPLNFIINKFWAYKNK